MSKTGSYRWSVVALLFFATTINYVDRQVIGILKPYIEGELGWGEQGYGIIITSFQIAYGIGLIVTGSVLDRIGTRLGYTISIVIWSIAGIGHAIAHSVTGFSIARFSLGIGESANFPAAVKATAEWFPKKDRAFATGWFNSGSNIGAITAPFIVAFAYEIYGWEWAFIITGSLGFIWLVFWLIFYQVPARHTKITQQEYDYIHSDHEKEEKKLPWAKIFPHRQTLGICLLRLITDWVWWFFLFWTPDYLAKKFNIEIKEQIIPLVVIYTVASFGGIFGGWLSSNMIKKGKNIDFARKTTILIIACFVLPLIAVNYLSTIELVIVLIAIAAGCHQGWASNIFTIVSDIYPKNAVGSMVGLSGAFGSLGGAIMGVTVGYILDVTGNYFIIFALASSMYLLAWFLLKLFIPTIEPIEIT
jgi:ACS family hexuronate transporter-like MFS transporter